MNKKVYITIGCAGSGKSSYIEKHIKENEIWLSSDNIRLEVFGDLTHQTKQDNTKIFDIMFSRLKVFLKDEINTTCYYDATNLSRKRRIHLYNEIKRFNKDNEVISLMFIVPLQMLFDRNKLREEYKQVPENVIKNMYKDFQIPKENVDCDIMINVYSKRYKNEFAKEYEGDISHDSPYHKETVREHINYVVENIKKSKNDEKFISDIEFAALYTKFTEETLFDILLKVGEYHDLGKFVCKEYIQEKGFCRFSNHEYVSSMYFIANCNEKLTEEEKMIADIIYNHMKAHNPEILKKLMFKQISLAEYNLLTLFSEIDNKSRIVGEE